MREEEVEKVREVFEEVCKKHRENLHFRSIRAGKRKMRMGCSAKKETIDKIDKEVSDQIYELKDTKSVSFLKKKQSIILCKEDRKLWTYSILIEW